MHDYFAPEQLSMPLNLAATPLSPPPPTVPRRFPVAIQISHEEALRMQALHAAHNGAPITREQADADLEEVLGAGYTAMIGAIGKAGRQVAIMVEPAPITKPDLVITRDDLKRIRIPFVRPRGNRYSPR